MEKMERLGAIDTRAGVPRAVELSLCEGHDFITFSGTCACNRATVKRYAVVGTAYGFLHNSAGEWRMWKSASGARRAAAKYRALMCS